MGDIQLEDGLVSRIIVYEKSKDQKVTLKLNCRKKPLTVVKALIACYVMCSVAANVPISWARTKDPLINSQML